MMYDILVLREEINRVVMNFAGIDGINDGMFVELSLPIPRFTMSELGFIRTVSWLYALYNEVGKVNVDFITERFSAYDLDPDKKLSTHREMVTKLRTCLQHNLDPTKLHDRRIQEDCLNWFQDHCRTPEPGSDEQWNECLNGLLTEAVDFFKAIKECTRRIEQDESRDQVFRDWDFQRKRYHPPHQFDALIPVVAKDMGRDSIDPILLRKRFYNKWIKELSLLTGEYEFEVEARKLIEHILLHETTPTLPITGKDIMKEFNIPPGPDVGELLEKARMLYESNPCPDDVLISKLRQHIDETDN